MLALNFHVSNPSQQISYSNRTLLLHQQPKNFNFARISTALLNLVRQTLLFVLIPNSVCSEFVTSLNTLGSATWTAK
jgi:hypothetical protein